MTGAEHKVSNPDFAADVRRAVMGLPAARLLGFRITRLAPGEAELELPFREALSSRGVFQGGILGALADFAGGSAAGTLLPRQTVNVTADYTVKLLAPAAGEKVVAQARVLRSGKTATVAQADLYAVSGDRRTLCATALVTMRNISHAV